MKQHRLLVIAIVITVVFSIAIVWNIAARRSESPAHATNDACAGEDGCEEDTPQISGLALAPVTLGESYNSITATGRVTPNTNRVVKVGPRIAGRIVKVHVNAGDTVTSGQTLALVSCVELAQARAALRQADAKVKAARESYEQRVRLAEMGAYTARPLEDARSEHISAQGELAQSKGEVSQLKSELVRAEAELAQCEARLSRARELYKDQIVSRHDLETAEAEFKRDNAEVDVLRSRIRQAEGKVEQMAARTGVSKSYMEREQRIYGSNVNATREVQAAKAELTAARMELQAASATISALGASPGGSGDTIAINSPLSGRVVQRDVSLGEMVDPSRTLFTIMNLTDVWVDADVYEKDLAKVAQGQRAVVRVNTYPDRIFEGKITYISDVLDTVSHTAKIRCQAPNPGGLLKPEMFASIDIVTGSKSKSVLAPRRAILDDAGKKIAFVACRDCPEDRGSGRSCGDYDRREVELGPIRGGNVEVIAGLAPGDEVVTEGAYQLKTALGSGKLEAGCTDH